MANDHNIAKWTAGTILFGGKELHTVSAGSTNDAAPIGIGTTLTDNLRYIVFWDRRNPDIFQTILESSYVESEHRVIVIEVTGAASGEKVQIQSKDASYGASDKLNSDSFNKIVGGTFSTAH